MPTPRLYPHPIVLEVSVLCHVREAPAAKSDPAPIALQAGDISKP
jgi:hypothetical protein